MTRKSKTPRVHIMASVVRYTDSYYCNIDFDDVWGFARVGSKVVVWEGSAHNHITLRYGKESSCFAEWAKRLSPEKNVEAGYNNMTRNYILEYASKLPEVLWSFVNSDDKTRDVRFVDIK